MRPEKIQFFSGVSRLMKNGLKLRFRVLYAAKPRKRDFFLEIADYLTAVSTNFAALFIYFNDNILLFSKLC